MPLYAVRTYAEYRPYGRQTIVDALSIICVNIIIFHTSYAIVEERVGKCNTAY